jgi:hypothetical protein
MKAANHRIDLLLSWSRRYPLSVIAAVLSWSLGCPLHGSVLLFEANFLGIRANATSLSQNVSRPPNWFPNKGAW